MRIAERDSKPLTHSGNQPPGASKNTGVGRPGRCIGKNRLIIRLLPRHGTVRYGHDKSLMNHVLIVEDREADRKVLKMLLERNGYRVTTAGDGVEALAAARRDRPDAIVSDVLMPNMDGFVLCHTWMQDAELKAIPFIFYTANLTSQQDAHVARTMGAVRYLIKPLEADVFLRELRTVLQPWTKHARPGT